MANTYPENPVNQNNLLDISPDELSFFLARNEEMMLRSRHPWSDYMRAKFREHEVLQQNVFLAADIPERYGYKLISGEKHTTDRDTILRICLAAEFTLGETQESLILYGMAPLYWRIPRDAAFIVVFNHRIYDIHDVDAILRENNLPPFLLDEEENLPVTT